MAAMQETFVHAAEAAAELAPLIGAFKKVTGDVAVAHARGPRWLRRTPQIQAEYSRDDAIFQIVAAGFTKLTDVEHATAGLVLACGSALPGLQLAVSDDGNIAAVITHLLEEAEPAPAVSPEIVKRMLSTALAGVGLVGAYVLFMNLCDAGLSQREAGRRAHRAFRCYDRLLTANKAWEALTRAAGRV